MREAALSVVASGVVSLADLEALTGYHFSEKNGDGMPSSNDDDASSEAATEVSECCSIAGSDLSESTLDEEFTASSPARRSNVCKFLSRRRTATKWVRVGYGRYVKVQE
ncbi:hypothetical protein PInf_001718 [Phytophthora infestans]|nr:hypothetical protein PInf_001718 [Phytophthora infestans]